MYAALRRLLRSRHPLRHSMTQQGTEQCVERMACSLEVLRKGALQAARLDAPARPKPQGWDPVGGLTGHWLPLSSPVRVLMTKSRNKALLSRALGRRENGCVEDRLRLQRSSSVAETRAFPRCCLAVLAKWSIPRLLAAPPNAEWRRAHTGAGWFTT